MYTIFLTDWSDSILTRGGSIRRTTRYLLFILAAVLLCSAPALGQEPGSAATTYTIAVQEDGSAIWQIEYRTLLSTADDRAAFENYTRDLPSVYQPQVVELMQRSAGQAAIATSRPMAVSNVTGNAVVQTSPTGRYGVVIYTFSWSGFAKPDGTLAVGDAFAGGLYLGKDSVLILRYPHGWSVARAEPGPDQVRDELVWFGLRTFAPGEPRVLLERSSFPLIPAIGALILVSIAGAGWMVWKRREELPEEQAVSDPAAPNMTEAEAAGLEERIIGLLEAAGGEQHQSEIVKALGVPKSTVSSSLNTLHAKGRIVKVRKGRENIIRLVQERNQSPAPAGK